MTWSVGIAQLSHNLLRGGGKNPPNSGLGIFAPTANLVVSLMHNTDPAYFAIVNSFNRYLGYFLRIWA